MRLMTRKEMIIYCLLDQKKRGIEVVQTDEQLKYQLKCRLKGNGATKAMSWADCKEWYDEVKQMED